MPKTVKRHEVRILLIEDNPGDARLIEQRLRWESIPGIADASSIAHAVTLKDGIERLEEEAYDVVLLDLGLPESTGIETLERLLAHTSSIPIVVLTGLDDTESAIEAIQKGAQDYLVKDEISSRLLKQTIRYAIERKRTTEKLRESMEKLRAMFESIGDGVILTDLTGTIMEANDTAAHLVGYGDKSGLIGQNAYEFIHPEDRNLAEETIKKAIEEGQARERMEYRILTTDGREIDTDFSAGLLYNDSGNPTGIIHVIKDITHHKRMEQELLKTQKLESIGVLAGGIAHDFNNILTGILGNISLAEMYTDDDRVSERLEEAEKASMRAKELTERLITFSRGGAPIKEMISFTKPLMDSIAFALSGSNVRSEFFIPDDLWMVQVDKGQMNQAINNIVLNAIQAMPEGGMIEVSAANMSLDSECGIPVQPGAHIRISIQDHGIGICEEHIQRIFDPFFTTDESRSGLGLSTAYSIIKNHNGYITVESQVGTGTTFHIYLPAFPQEALPVAGIVSEEKEEAIASGGKILVVDDEELIRDLVIEMLNSLGYEAAVARDGAEAIALYKSAMEAEEPFDAVILDLIVPGGMGGEGIIRELTWIDPEIKAVVSSGYSIDPIMTDFRRHGFRGAIAKPYNIKELDQILRQVLAANTSYHQR